MAAQRMAFRIVLQLTTFLITLQEAIYWTKCHGQI